MLHSESTLKESACDQDLQCKHVSASEFASFISGNELRNRVIGSPQTSSAPEKAIRCIAQNGHGACAVCMMPVTYENGDATAYDPCRENVNQVQFLGCTDTFLHKATGLISRVIENSVKNHLVLINTQEDTLAAPLSSQGFVRVSRIRDHIKRYAFLPGAHERNESGEDHPSIPESIQFDESDSFYYHELARHFVFDFAELIHNGWTMYKRDGRSLLFTVTFGQNHSLNQHAFRLDVFDCDNGMFTGYNDVHVPDGSDSVFNDIPATGFSSHVPKGALEYLNKTGNALTYQADWIRNVWRNRDALWVHLQNRHLGIGRSLTRIACDISRYVYTGKKCMQVCANYVHLDVYNFHKRNGASYIGDGVYRLAYDFTAGERPLIAIVQHNC